MPNSSAGNYSPTDTVGIEYYEPYLNGGRKNPTRSRVRLITRMYERILSELAMNRFEWKGLPPSVDPRFLEACLYRQALSVFWFDKTYGKFFASQAAGMGRVNFMYNPVGFQVIGPLFRTHTISTMDCVPIWANYNRAPDLDIVQIYSSRLAEMDRTIEINSANARVQKAIITDENGKQTAFNIQRMFNEGQKDVVLQDASLVSNIIPVDLEVRPEGVEKLHIVRTRQWNECMALLGINSANQDKKERLVESEVGANDDIIENMRYVNLNARKYAAEQINARFGLDISVDFRSRDPEEIKYSEETDTEDDGA